MSEEWKGMNPMENGSGEYEDKNRNSSQEEQKETGFVLRDSMEDTGSSRESQETQEPQEPGSAPTPENPVYAHSYRNEEKKEGYNSYHFTSPTVSPEPEKAEKEEKKVKRDSGRKNSMGKKAAALAGGAIAFGVIAGAVFLGVSYAGSQLLPQQTTKIESTQVAADSSDVQNTNAGSSSGYTVAQVAENAMPSIVSITGISIQEIPNYFGYGTQQYQGESSGSGIIVGQNDTELLIATNAHVVANTDSITVCFTNQDGTAATSSDSTVEQTSTNSSDSSLKDGTYVEAQVKGSDTGNDLAVVSVKLSDIPEDILSQIKVATIGDSDSLAMGDQVVAIGNALGYGQSVTSGYVSALNKQVSSDSANGTFIQTDAAINPGNSGGALLNMKGELVGINSAKIASDEVEGMGFAIPISQAEPILDQLMSQETREKVEDENQASYLGVTCMDSTSTVNEMYNIPVGVFVYDVEEDGPADQAGIKKGDVITKIDGTSVQTKEDLTGRLEYYKAGETVDIVLYRTDNGEYKEQTVSVTLGAKKDSPTMSSQSGQE